VIVPGQKKHIVTLTSADRVALEKVTTTGAHPARVIMRARVLLELDANAGEVDYREVIAVGSGCRRRRSG
jgi:hypothetical protein